MSAMQSSGAASNSSRSLSAGLKQIVSVREFGLLAIIALIFVVMSFASPYFLTWGNMRAILLSFSIEGIVVIGMTILLIVGGIDLSVGSVVCLSMVIGGTLFLAGLDPWTASLIAIAACGFIGFLMGLCVTRIGLHFFIVSLAFMVITRGLSLLFTQGTPQSLFSLPPAFKFVGQGSLGGVPFVIVIFVVLIALFDVLLRRSVIFRRVYYTGSNEKAARLSGIDTKRMKVMCATICSHARRRCRRDLHGALRRGDAAVRRRHGAQRDCRGRDRWREPEWRLGHHRRRGAGGGTFVAGDIVADLAQRAGILAGHHPRRDPARCGDGRPSPQRTQGKGLKCRPPSTQRPKDCAASTACW